MNKIRKITNPIAWETLQARMDHAAITGQPMIERPFWYENTATGQLYYDLYGCIGWPTEVSDKDMGMPGYVAVVGVVKPKAEGKPIQDAALQLLAEMESRDIATLLNGVMSCREEYGFRVHPGLMQGFFGDPERFITALALLNERLIAKGGERESILIIPPDDFYVQHSFDHYVRSLRSVVSQEHVRFYFGGCEILKNHLREFKRDNPAVFAVGGLVHSLLSRTMWMDAHSREVAFCVEGEGDK